MRGIRAVILAAGEGTRMKSARSKVLHELFGKAIVSYCVEAARESGVRKVYVVAGSNRAELKKFFGGSVEIVHQAKRLGTGHAVMACEKALRGYDGDLFVLAGDAPLVRGATLAEFRSRFSKDGAAAGILTAELENPRGYGRILRNAAGEVTGIREDLDADECEKDIREVNSSMYCFRAKLLFAALKKVTPDNRKREYYLTDAISILAEQGEAVQGYALAGAAELLGINTRQDLADAAKEIWKRNLEAHMGAGVTVVSPGTTYIEAGVRIGADTVVHPFTHIEKDVAIGKNCSIGPFAKIRAGSRVKDGAAIGSFVEVVRSTVGENTLVKHLAYLGDATVGRGVNVGAGTITANYDGKNKNRTRIGDGAFLGCDTVLIAPVKVGRGARTGAGTVVPRGRNVPAGVTVVGVPAAVLKSKNKLKK
ncbi:MAG: NTP transferase domain-containing protein [Candidatus Omnitrophica bacterium]|nr:NTP transferase domain-containing protein [Candidatus Omnitrophota bacterium]